MTGAASRADLERTASAYGAEAERYRAAGEWGNQTIVEVFRGHVERRPAALAVATVEGALTYYELDRRSDALALGLVDAGLQPGDPVIFQMGNELRNRDRVRTVRSRRGSFRSAASRTTGCTRSARLRRRRGHGPMSFRPTTARTTSPA